MFALSKCVLYHRLDLVTELVTSRKLRILTSVPVGIELGDRLRTYTVNHLDMQRATQAKLTFYSQREGKLVLAKRQWQCSAAGKVTVSLVSHRRCNADFMLGVYCKLNSLM